MSSNLKIVKVCECCKQEFVARKTTSQTCSDPYAKRLYKLRQREKTINRAKLETEIKRQPQTYITEEQVRVIQTKDWLTLKEAALLLHVSPLTLRRWTLAGKIKSNKVGGKHMLYMVDLHKIP